MFQLAACLSNVDNRSDEPIAMIFVAIGATRQGARRETASVLTCSRIHRHIVEALAETRAWNDMDGGTLRAILEEIHLVRAHAVKDTIETPTACELVISFARLRSRLSEDVSLR
jgi:hypothetical protein